MEDKKILRKEFKKVKLISTPLHLIYFEILNVNYNIQSSGYYYCFCDKFQGCAIGCYDSIRCCPICQIQLHYDLDDVESIKYKPKELFD